MVGVGLQVAGLVLKGLDLMVWLITFGPIWMAMQKSRVKSVRAKVVGEEDVNGDLPPSKIFWAAESIASGKLTTRPMPDIGTLYDMARRAISVYANKNALGTRTFLENKMLEGVRFPTKVFGSTKWLTFKEVGENFLSFGSGLRKLGMNPLHLEQDQSFNDVSGDHTLLIYEDTCAEWFMAAQGAMSQSMVVATAYATLGVDSVISAVNEANIPTIFCNYHNVSNILAKKDKMPSLKNIIYSTLYVTPDQCVKQPASDDTIGVYSFAEIVALGKEAAIEPSPPHPRDIAILMYTSGSTGKPKGVMVRHSQIVCLLGAIKERAHLNEGEVLVGYLPLAHIFEMQMEFFCFGYGGAIGYADPKSLVAGPGKCLPTGALQEFRPTVLGAVPKVWEVIKSGAEAKIKAGGEGKSYLFNTALQWKKGALPNYRGTPVFDKLVFSKISATLGGRLRLAVSGGGAISADVQEWVRTVLGVPLIQGYGLTETCAGLTVQAVDDWRVGVAGAPIATVETLVHSEADICDSDNKPYLSTDTMHMGTPCQGRGEIWVRGTNVTDGYYKMPAETASEYDEKKWFHTGDIGIILMDGSIKIVDRKKNLVKLKGGEYVALEKMNLAFNPCEIVDTDAGGCSAYGDSDMDRPICFVQCKVDGLKKLAEELGVSGTPEELCKNEKIQAEVVKSLNKRGKEVDPPLSSLETLAGVALLVKPWSAADGTLTASLKIVPKRIQAAHAAELAIAKKKGIR
eukprot:TRINITY_DN5521_c0_g1_i1.p1 TRINITY_DN5521_c0_g1~~TRINITY_DN5521_c0_g1_i1.p1  ORF type:complete len:740 (+),score=260.57 TRINITY_DN5521_c0_g1_i1:45-2264(+)